MSNIKAINVNHAMEAVRFFDLALSVRMESVMMGVFVQGAMAQEMFTRFVRSAKERDSFVKSNGCRMRFSAFEIDQSNVASQGQGIWMRSTGCIQPKTA